MLVPIQEGQFCIFSPESCGKSGRCTHAQAAPYILQTQLLTIRPNGPLVHLGKIWIGGLHLAITRPNDVFHE